MYCKCNVRPYFICGCGKERAPLDPATQQIVIMFLIVITTFVLTSPLLSRFTSSLLIHLLPSLTALFVYLSIKSLTSKRLTASSNKISADHSAADLKNRSLSATRAFDNYPVDAADSITPGFDVNLELNHYQPDELRKVTEEQSDASLDCQQHPAQDDVLMHLVDFDFDRLCRLVAGRSFKEVIEIYSREETAAREALCQRELINTQAALNYVERLKVVNDQLSATEKSLCQMTSQLGSSDSKIIQGKTIFVRQAQAIDTDDVLNAQLLGARSGVTERAATKRKFIDKT